MITRSAATSRSRRAWICGREKSAFSTSKAFKGKGGKVPGGAATVLDLPLDPAKELKSLTVRALANEVVIGLMSVTLAR